MITAASSDDEVRAHIQSVYDAGPWELGWTYIFGQPESRRTPRIVTIGLNPGGGRGVGDWGSDCLLHQGHTPQITNAYLDQPWGKDGLFNPLQQQIQHLHRLNPDVLKSEWLSFQFVPFRSPGWADLPAKETAVALGEELLEWALATARPDLIVGFGLGPVAGRILRFLKAEEIERSLLGWGTLRAKVYRSTRFSRIVLLPHLSRFRVLGRGAFADEARLLASCA